MKKIIMAVLGVLLLTVFSLSGCSGTPDQTPQTQATQQAQTSAPTVALTTSALHISHLNDQQTDYGKGDYLYDTITFTGSALGKATVVNTRELETLASDQSKALGFEGTYSFKNSGGVYSSQTFTGIRLYDYLLSLGMKDNLPDDTPVAVHAIDGNVVTLELGQLKDSTYKYYTKNEQLKAENLPIMLSFGANGIPLVGPTGDQPTTTEFTAAMGYDTSADNVGGPVKLTLGQTDFSDFNARFNNKWVDRITVGDETNYELHSGATARAKILQVTVYDGDNVGSSKDYTWNDLETFATASTHNQARNYYGDGNFYEGADLWSLLANDLKLPSYDGYVELVYADGTSEQVDLAYLQNISGNYSNYVTKKDGSTITCVKPIIAYSENGQPLADTAIAALPIDGTYKTTASQTAVSALNIHLGAATATTTTEDNSQQVALSGDGLKQAATMSVEQLTQQLSLQFTATYDGAQYSGLNLLRFLQEQGLTVDAESIIVSNGQKQMTLSLADLKAQADQTGSQLTMLAYAKDGQAINNASGGPLILETPNGSLTDVTAIEVTAKVGQWNHFDGDPQKYESYLDQPTLRVYGSEANQDVTLTLRDLETMKYAIVRDSYASGGGCFGYEGILLRAIVEKYLADGVERPSQVTVTDGSYYISVNIDDLYNGIESRYQEGQRRDIILAYGIDGVPLVPNENSVGYVGNNAFGPLRLIVENSIYQWVKGASEVIIGDADVLHAQNTVSDQNSSAETSPTASNNGHTGLVIVLIVIIVAAIIAIIAVMRYHRKQK